MIPERRQRRERPAEDREFDQRVIEVARVTRVMAGGKRMRFRACVIIGDRKGRIGYGIGKGADVAMAVSKAISKAKKELITVPLRGETIPYQVKSKFKAARLLLRPAPPGTGIMAGGAVRSALEVSGIGDIVAKMFGSKNKINNIKALFTALASFAPRQSASPVVTEPAGEEAGEAVKGETQAKE